MRDRTGVRRTVVVIAMSTVVMAGCATTVSGTGQQVPQPSPTLAPSPAASSAPRLQGSSTALASRLASPPAGSHPWANTWGSTAYPTMTEVVDYLYDPADQSAELNVLEMNGVDAIAHRTWLAADASELDTLLLHFTTSAGAQAQFDRLTTGLAAAPGVTPSGSMRRAAPRSFSRSSTPTSPVTGTHTHG